MRRTPYQVILSRYVTEKSKVLESLKDSESSKSIKRCESPKYVFIVDDKANKAEIADAVENIFENIKVTKVNTIRVKPKKKRVRGRIGKTKKVKKAIVTLSKGDLIKEQV